MVNLMIRPILLKLMALLPCVLVTSCGETGNNQEAAIAVATKRASTAERLNITEIRDKWNQRQLAALGINGTNGTYGPDGVNVPTVNGIATTSQEFDAVGMLLASPSADGHIKTPACSGTLIAALPFGPPRFLTAAHCISDHESHFYWAYFQHVGIIRVDTVTPFCQKDDICNSAEYPYLRENDVAILELDADSLNAEQRLLLRLIEPLEIANENEWQPEIPTRIVGFGLTGTDLSYRDLAIKRTVTVVSDDSCDENFSAFSICFSIEANCSPASAPVCTVNGHVDSGGPMLLEDGASRVLLGVASRAGIYLDVSRPGYRDWIAAPNLPGLRLPTLHERIDLQQECIIDKEGGEDEEICFLSCADLQGEEECADIYDVVVNEGISYVVATLSFPPKKGEQGVTLPPRPRDFELHLTNGVTASDCVEDDINRQWIPSRSRLQE